MTHGLSSQSSRAWSPDNPWGQGPALVPLSPPPCSPAVRDLSRQQDFLPAFESVCEDIGLHKDQIVVLSDDGEARCPLAHPHPLGPLRSVATQQAGARQALTPGHCAPQIAARVPETRASAHAGE